MLDRKNLVFTLWIVSALVLLASVLVTPVPAWGFIAVPSRPDVLRLDFASTLGQPIPSLDAATDTDPVPQVNVLPFEDEEQDRADAPEKPSVSFLFPRSLRKIHDGHLTTIRSVLSPYPLRC